MQVVVDRVLNVSHADGAAVELVDGSEMVCRATSLNLQRLQRFRWPRQGSLSGLSVDTAQVLNCNDTETDPRVNLQLCRRIGTRSIACAPMMANGMALGVLKALAPEPDRFCDESLQLFRLLARTLGTALARQIAFDAALAKATKTVEAAAAAQADFMANMSHEIRTLLKAVIGFTSLCQLSRACAPLDRRVFGNGPFEISPL